jgi:small subunit ribosomal protein S18
VAKVMNRKRPRKPKVVRERAECRFCRDKTGYIDYKDLDGLSKLLTQRGKLFSAKRSGNCAGCQRKSKKAVKRARYMALLPYAI